MRRIHNVTIAIFIIAVFVFGFYKYTTIANYEALGPEISMEESSITVSVAATEEELLKGIFATDKKDGDVSDSLMVETMGNFIEAGRRTITVVAFDSDNHVTKATREVVYSDYQLPRFSMSEPLRFPEKTTNILQYMSANDVIDGNLTSNIKISSDYYVEADEEGTYPVIFTVTNSGGDVAKLPVTVEIYDASKENQKPHIDLSQYVVYTPLGVPIDPWNYVERITIGGNEFIRRDDGILYDLSPAEGQEKTTITREEVSITHQVQTHNAGVYEITYQVEGLNGEPGTVNLILVVGQ